MLSFFRINDPYRLIGVFLLLIIFRLPFWFSDIGITLPGLTWSLVANRLSEGATMYRDVWDYLSPLSAGFYWLTFLVFKNSFVAGQILSVLVIFIQAAIFNTILINHGVLSENTYIPAMVYVVLASLFFDYFILTPVVLANTFILLTINNVFGQVEIRAKRDEKLLMTGIYSGTATLFHFPYFIFGLIVLIVFLFFTATVRRRYFLFLFGWILPIVLAMLYYFYNDSFGMFWRNNVSSWFLLESKSYFSNTQVLIIGGYVALFIILALFRIFLRARLTNYQSRLIQVVFFSMILSSSILLIELDRYPFIYFLFVFPAAFFISHFFTLTKKSFLAELAFIIFIAGVGTINYLSIVDTKREGLFSIDSYIVENSKEDEKFEGKRIFYVGDNVSIYRGAYPATPFINWRLSAEVWENSRQLKNITIIGHSIEKDKPDIIIDQMGLLPKVFLQAPKLANEYRKDGQMYYRLPSN